MEHNSELVADGKLLHETSYPQRPEKYTEIEIGGSKIDFYDAKNKVIHEIKRSDKMEEAHLWQVKYYIYLLQKDSVSGVTARLEYPKLKQTLSVHLEPTDEMYLGTIIAEIERITGSDYCPPLLHAKLCKKCAYYDFCYSTE